MNNVWVCNDQMKKEYYITFIKNLKIFYLPKKSIFIIISKINFYAISPSYYPLFYSWSKV